MRLIGLEMLSFIETNRPVDSHSEINKDSSGDSHVNLSIWKSVAVNPEVTNVRTSKTMNQRRIAINYK
jgi:DNA/RNA endonuclease YhcR with UshA esterase domain